MNDNIIIEGRVLGLDIERLKTIASLSEIDEEGGAHHIAKAADGLDMERDYLRECEYFASLSGLSPEDRDKEIDRAIKILEVIGETQFLYSLKE